ncbi:MAG: glycosyltransferase, partial [Polaribacter sp.]
MKILHIVENYSFASGGIRTVVKNLKNQLFLLNYKSLIISSGKEKDDNVIIVNSNKTPWLFSKDWQRKIQKIHQQEKLDCIHIHGVWMYPQYVAAKFALQYNIPFILSPHGMYEPWLWSKGTTKKKFYFNFLVKKKFSKASIIHAITKQEKENLRVLFPNTKIIEIPNLIEEMQQKSVTISSNEKYIFYIGRLDE